ncbi:MAG TPA: S8 family serine peptidase, partial [Longimicrobium sp.]|nr:S8 family serine peptidase [Longimicrobium sp.]
MSALAACSDTTDPTLSGGQQALEQVQMGTQVDEVVPGEVVVKFKSGVNVAAKAGAYGASIGHMGYKNEFAVLRTARGSERMLAARLASDPNVEYAEPNFLRQPTAIDSRIWAAYNPGGLTITYTKGGSGVVTSKVSVADADIDGIETIGAGGSPVVIGSIDTGVNLAHTEFLPGQLIAGKDWYSNDTNPTDTDDHGTHTSGTMAGRTAGVAGITGAGINVKIHVQRVCGQRGCPTSAIVSAIRAAADVPGMVAMNLSLGGTSESQAEKDAISYA